MNIDFRHLLGALAVPSLAVAYALYALWEQSEEFYREDTTQYMMVLIVPVLVLAGVVILRSLFESWQAGQRAACSGSAQADANEGAGAPPDRGRYLRPTLLVAASIVLVLVLEQVGYLIAFTLFVIAVLLAMGVRAPWRIAAIAVCTMVVVHVVFIEILDQPLPRGWLDAWSE